LGRFASVACAAGRSGGNGRTGKARTDLKRRRRKTATTRPALTCDAPWARLAGCGISAPTFYFDDIFIRRAAIRRLHFEHEQRLEEDYSYALRHRYGKPVTDEWEPSSEDVLREIEKIRAEHRYLGKIFRKRPGQGRNKT
jgi:hypothetical protein